VCTLILLLRQVPGWPIVVGSNRDEHFARPAAPPALFASEGERFVAPQDLQAGGTWMGVNAQGLFVGVTNRRSAVEPPPAVRSRGALVRQLLGLPDLAAMARALERCDGAYRPFHVVASDALGALLATLREPGSAVDVEALGPGSHVVCNVPDSTKVRDLQAKVRSIDAAAGLPATRAALAALLESHARGEGSLDDVCVHLPEYGTRSSAILGIGSRWHWWQTEGPPCQSKYQNYSRLLDSIQSQAPIH
jgi:uncharacterized protein with NRDE domain